MPLRMLQLIKCVPCFMKFGAGVQTILKLSVRNLRDCNSDITDWRYLLITPLRLGQ
jgi:hypothetical protein